jgi:hypothetical protein
MRPLFIIFLFAVSIIPVLPVFSQNVPMILRVKRIESTDYSTKTTYYTYGSDTVQFRIEVVNGSTGAVSNVQIRWAVLVQPKSSSEIKLIEDTKTCDLQRSQTYTLETDVFALTSFSRYYGTSTRTFNAELLGYMVEVIVNGKVSTFEARPLDIKQRIEHLRIAKSRPAPEIPPEEPKKKKHSF